jgi:hypothetical protein
MRKNSLSESGLFNPRIFAAFLLCSMGVCLAMFSFAAPTPSTNTTDTFKPVVIQSIANGVSPAVRDLPRALPTTQRVEIELPPIRPSQPVPSGFVDPARQNSAAALAMPTPIATFEGQSSVDSAGGSAAGCICTPPDPNGAVGPTQYVQMVNSVFSVYQKTSGVRLSGPTQINSLFQSLPDTSRCRIDNNGDPVVVYDQLADRWLVSQFAVGAGSGPTSSECIAISKGPDATGEYYIYDFDLGPQFEDYPHFGLWPDAYYMSTHEFSFASGNPFLGSAAWAFERDKMLAGQTARLVKFKLGSTTNTFFGGHLPSNLDGFTLPPAGSPNYFAEVDALGDGTRPDGAPAQSALDIWQFHVDWANPLNSTFGNNGNPSSLTPVTPFFRPGCTVNASGNCVSEDVPQAGDPGQLAAIGDRLMYRNAYRNFGDHESLVLNHTVVAQIVMGHTVQMGPRWYEVRNPGGTAPLNPPVIFQQSTFGPTGQTDLLYRWMSSVAMDRMGDIAIGYSTSNLANFPSIAWAGRLSTDLPLSTLAQGEAQMFAGTGPQHNELFIPFSPTGFGRWGDYTDMTVDPVDDCAFWYTNMYYSSTDAPAGIWHTRIGSFKFPSCTARQTGFLRGTVTDSGTSNPIAGASVTAGGYTAITNNSGFYQFSPLSPGAYTDTASATGYFSSSASVTVTNNGTTTQNFALARNGQPIPTPTPTQLQTVNPPVLNDPGTTINTNNYTVTWTPAEVTSGLANYVVEESTDYVQPIFDNADGTVTPPATVGPLWTTGDSTGDTTGWIQSPANHNSGSFSYEGPAPGPVPLQFDPDLTLKNNITIPASVGSARLNFYSRYFNGPDDTGNVEISTNGGATWSSLRVLTDSPSPPPADTRMQNQEVDLSPYKGIPFKFRFRFDGGTTVNFLILSVGWWVDDINVDGATWTQIGTTGPTTTSLNITGKPNGHYYYRVRGTYTNGSSTNHSNVQDIIVNGPKLLSVASSKVHGSVGTFNVDMPLIGTRGVECRSAGHLPGGAADDYQLVFTFENNLSSVASATVSGHNPTGATGTVDGPVIVGPNASYGLSANQCAVNLMNVSNAQYITVRLNSALDAAGRTGDIISPQMGALVGDVNATAGVDGNDVSAVQSHTRQNASASTFRFDVNATGGIDGNDVSLTQSKTRTSLPSLP